MSSFGRYTPRRRRVDEEERESGGLPVIPLMIIVVFAGLLLGGLLAHFFGGRGSPSRQAMNPANPPPVTPVSIATPLVATPHARPSGKTSRHPTPHATPPPSASPSPSVSPARPSAKPTPSISAIAVLPRKPQKTLAPNSIAIATATASTAPLTAPAATPTLQAVVTASPTRPTPFAIHRPPLSRTVSLREPRTPEGIVRAYLTDLARGDRDAAASYLSSGAPTEDFMRGGHVGSITTFNNGDGTYQVTANVSTPDGRYYVIATVAALPYGLLITDHYHIRPR
jgi:hypothetical protein